MSSNVVPSGRAASTPSRSLPRQVSAIGDDTIVSTARVSAAGHLTGVGATDVASSSERAALIACSLLVETRPKAVVDFFVAVARSEPPCRCGHRLAYR
jgi:hypothetical protein